MHNIFSYATAKLNLCLFFWNVGKLDRIKIEHCIFRILFKLFFLSLFEINFNQRERNENSRNNSKRKKKKIHTLQRMSYKFSYLLLWLKLIL